MKCKHNCPLCGGNVYSHDSEEDWHCIKCGFDLPMGILLGGEEVIGMMTNPLYIELISKLLGKEYTVEDPRYQLRQAMTLVQQLREQIRNCDHDWAEGQVTLGTRSNTTYAGTEREQTESYYVREQTRKCVKCGYEQVRESRDPRDGLGNWHDLEKSLEITP